MYLVRNIFHAKPGMVKELVKRWKEALPYADKKGFKNGRLLTDVSSTFWTFIYEFEVDSLSAFEDGDTFTSEPEVRKIMEGYMDFVEGGYREIFKIA